jgi:tRNA(Ile2)-agmatinylcytidine synthase
MRIAFKDYPNIIRLNPNIPYKTRGNAAVALRLGITQSDYQDLTETSIRTIEKNSRVGDAGTDPAIVFLTGKPSPEVKRLSRKAMTGVISVEDATRTLRRTSGIAISYGTGLGLVGALAAAGNTLEGDYTYELIAYRSAKNVGTPRQVDEKSVIRMDRLTRPNTFSNYDSENKRILIKPHGPDPVLFGLRGETPEAVRTGFHMVRVHEPIERWVIFRTNHGTEAHFDDTGAHPRAYHPSVLHGAVCSRPLRIVGGHVFVDIRTLAGIMKCAAFEPTGKFKEIVAELIPGDRVVVFGGVRESIHDNSTLTLNLEKIVIERLAEETIAENPKCPKCGRRLKSAGWQQGFRCSRCKYTSRTANKQFRSRMRKIVPGVYLPDRKAHRHLTKPFSRYGLEKRIWDGKPPTGIWHRP